MVFKRAFTLMAALTAAIAMIPAPAWAVGGATKNLVEGRITANATGAALTGICVIAKPLPLDAQSFQTQSGVNGYYKLLLPDGTYLLLFRDCSATPVYFDQWYFNANGPAGATQLKLGGALTPAQLEIDASMKTGAVLSGVVTAGDTGSPLANVCVEAQRNGQPTKRTTTDANGHYSLDLTDGDWGVHFTDCNQTPLYLPAGGLAHIKGAESHAVSLDVSMPRGGTVSGQVTDDVTGAPIGGICVSGPGPKIAYTDASGNYTVTDVPSGQFWVTFTDCGSGVSGSEYAKEYYHHAATSSEATEVAVTAPSNTVVNETLIQSGSISGTVTDAATGAPLSGVNVWVWHHGAWTGVGVRTGTDGSYVITGLLPEQDYAIQFFDYNDHYARQWWNGQASQDQAQPVAVTSNNTTTGIDAAMVSSS